MISQEQTILVKGKFHMFKGLFYIDQLSILMICITSIVGMSVITFSRRYLNGDLAYNRFFINLSLLLISITLMIISDHIALFLVSWAIINALLVLLMIHKASWKASLESGLIAKRYFIFGLLMTALSISLLAYHANTTSIQKIIYFNYDSHILNISLMLLLLGAMAQSSIWPFHKWLICTLNSPTPVSAIMHAGIVNGGGFLLIRFSPLFIKNSYFLDFIFTIGFLTAVLGTAWKLIQSDVKKLLACSTMGQMGFMFMQCGLGLFSAALAHLCFHSFFKAYLFLASGSVAQEKKISLDYPPKLLALAMSILNGALGSLMFVFAEHKSNLALDTNLFLIFVTLIAGTQVSISILSNLSLKRMLIATVGVICFGGFYGICVYTIENMVEPLYLLQAQSLNWMHITGILLFCFLWFVMIGSNYLEQILERYPVAQILYVKMLNLSQPDSRTVTSHRNNYRYS